MNNVVLGYLSLNFECLIFGINCLEVMPLLQRKHIFFISDWGYKTHGSIRKTREIIMARFL